MIVSTSRPGANLALSGNERVLVLGAYGAGNTGDEAVLAGLLASLGSHDRVAVISRDPLATQRMHGVRSVGVRDAPLELRRVDALVIGGGGLFSSHVGVRAKAIPLFGLIALAAGKRLIIEGVSVDSTTPRVVKAGLIQMARRAESVTVRDDASARLLRAWGAGFAEVGPDLSEYLSPAPVVEAAAVLESAGLDLGKPIVALCLNAVDPKFDEFLQFDVPGLCRRMPGVQFCFLPMSHHPNVKRHDDARLGRWLKQRAPEIAVLDDEIHPAVALALFEQFSVAVCMRYHSFLFAERAGTPIVGVPYAAKCRRWMAERCLQPVGPGSAALARAVSGALMHCPGELKCSH